MVANLTVSCFPACEKNVETNYNTKLTDNYDQINTNPQL